MKQNFKQKCETTADKFNLEVEFYPDKSPASCFYDDDVLHIRRNGTRACFILGYDTKPSIQNNLTRLIMNDLELKITDGVLTDETHENNEEDEL